MATDPKTTPGDMNETKLFAGVSADELEIVIKHCTEKTFLGGEPVFKEGEEGDSLWLVESGSVEVFKTIRGDVDRVLGTIGPGEIFGEMSFIDGSKRSASARTGEPSHLLTLSRGAFNKLAEDQPGVAASTFAALAAILAERLRHTNDAYKEAVSSFLETAGLAPLHLHRMVENLRLVTIHLLGGSAVTGRLLDFEQQPAGWTLFVKDQHEKISLIPYASIVRIEIV
jgi:CRP-like cAMP-binding protein